MLKNNVNDVEIDSIMEETLSTIQVPKLEEKYSSENLFNYKKEKNQLLAVAEKTSLVDKILNLFIEYLENTIKYFI